MRYVKFDQTTYNQTKDLPGGPVLGVVEEQIHDIDIFCDKNGKPTRGGMIGYALAYLLMAGFIASLFFFL
ncbi:hypothetical protein M527_04810 [Sphingobium indicum IP26]|uniref:Uncharacterized protein n=1 Tax=Sphingobium indicum F2 TaxID=1450518 RepID=A0A8E0WVD3_9SPHN|nr:hypothetical protein [Sphingobium indicum]EPR11039.1 hypothetical protein M527_02925 [Sphingobium indicum IP26]EPR11409.1 hypothetical protein M527_04810 [Sphingobium indicum IP26]KER38178.1 hypothetical protein AL00_02290 [Sphingobium indicum F2]